jgi:two-component system, NarL family, sensor kinase
MILDEVRRARRVSHSPASNAGRWLAIVLVSLVLLAWAATLYAIVLVADGLSETNSHLDWWAHLIAVVLIAVTIRPLWRWLRPAVDDVVYGHLDDAYTVVTQLGRQIDVVAPSGAASVDSSVAEMIAHRLNVPYVAIVNGDTEISTVGLVPSDRDLADVPLSYKDIQIGHLYVAPRHPHTNLSNRDHTLLSDLAQQLGVALYAIRASEQVQESRAALVTAREEERRRIRRDLHDGLGPTLASMKLQLAAASRVLEAEPGRAAHLLDEVRTCMDDTTADIRRLVYGLRPPLIDELGLIAALRSHPAAQSGLDLTVCPENLPELPAAVEVALYRIASEAIHNAARHSGGLRCTVIITVTADEVSMLVEDDGRGLPEPLVAGVGVSAMRERAAELGGTLDWSGATGTTVMAVIPLRSSGQQ